MIVYGLKVQPLTGLNMATAGVYPLPEKYNVL